MLTIYGIYIAIFTKPVLFTGLLFSWSFNPFIGYLTDNNSTYVNYLHTVHDTSVAIILPVIYAASFFLFVVKTKAARSQIKEVSRKQKMLFIQILIIGLIHLVGCLLYASLPYINFAAEIVYLAQFLWYFAHGIPPFLYLTMNKTIRNDLLRSFKEFVHKNELIGDSVDIAVLNNTVKPLVLHGSV
uniref:Uncharacterized protein n=1 Tax=Ditylenchus dipsaci TaxID=166011 RepID=A0A915CWW9_9BILA